MSDTRTPARASSSTVLRTDASSTTDRTPDRTPDRAPDPTLEMFASRSLTEHVVRGLLGLVLVSFAVVSAQDHPWALLALVPAVAAWRGCPTCWLLGLGATLTRRRTGRACDTC